MKDEFFTLTIPGELYWPLQKWLWEQGYTLQFDDRLAAAPRRPPRDGRPPVTPPGVGTDRP